MKASGKRRDRLEDETGGKNLVFEMSLQLYMTRLCLYMKDALALDD